VARRKTAKRKSWSAIWRAFPWHTKLAAGALALLLLGIGIGLALKPAPRPAAPQVAARAPVAPLAAPEVIAPPPPRPPAPEPPQQQASVPPTPAKNELPPWRRYAITEPAFDGRPRIAIVIDDVGVDRRRSQRAMGLPPQVTLSFLPYPDDIAAQTARARAAGHELLVHMPMQPDDLAHNDPGPNALLVNLDKAELQRRVQWNLDRFGEYVGVNNHMGSRFTADATAMAPVLEIFKSRGLMFLDSRTSPVSVGAPMARQLGIPTITRDVFLDNDDHADKVTRQLAITEQVARHQGHVVAIGHPHDGTLDALDRWLPTLAGKGFVLVPLTAIAVHPVNG
jgi:polysaccharide deacetylase 2 family uncharacterized protein YibQ